MAGVLSAATVFCMLVSGKAEAIGSISSFITAMSSLGLLILAAFGISEWKNKIRKEAAIGLLRVWGDFRFEVLMAVKELERLQRSLEEADTECKGASINPSDPKLECKYAKAYLKNAYALLSEIRYLPLDLPSETAHELQRIFDVIEEACLDSYGINLCDALVNNSQHANKADFLIVLKKCCRICNREVLTRVESDLGELARLDTY